MANITTIEVLHGSTADQKPSKLLNGQIAINNSKGKEKLYIRSQDSESSFVEFEPTESILLKVEDIITNTDIGGIRDEVDTIAGDGAGSFKKADEVLENKLTAKIQTKVSNITSSFGIKTDITPDEEGNRKATLQAITKADDHFLSVDSVSGIQSDIKLTIEGKTIFLVGRNENTYSSVTVPGDNLTFFGTEGVGLVKDGVNVTATLLLDPDETNQLQFKGNGLYISNIIDCGTY
jgi:hypothetical protein